MNITVWLAMIITVVGAGPSGLMAAEVLAAGGARVAVIDGMASPARKFLMAGRGGLNLTHAEPLDELLDRYGPARDRLEPAIRAFPPEALRHWADGLGAETFVGSSGRVFPKAMKASPLLRAWLARLSRLGVELRMRTRWEGFDGGPAVLAMGGASWPRLGSDGGWVPALRAAGIDVHDFQPSNSGVRIAWSERFRERFAGTPLKRIALSCQGAVVRGEAMITSDGLEGGAVYALSRQWREAGSLTIDLRPDLSAQALADRLARPRGKDSLSTWLRKSAGLAPAAIALLRERGAGPQQIKSLELPIHGPTGLERAISSAGGIDWSEVDDCFRLKKMPGVYAIGEMLDWEAPTGGYLLQACFSMGVMAARTILSDADKTST